MVLTNVHIWSSTSWSLMRCSASAGSMFALTMSESKSLPLCTFSPVPDNSVAMIRFLSSTSLVDMSRHALRLSWTILLRFDGWRQSGLRNTNDQP